MIIKQMTKIKTSLKPANMLITIDDTVIDTAAQNNDKEISKNRKIISKNLAHMENSNGIDEIPTKQHKSVIASKMQTLKNKKQTKPKHLRSHRTDKSEKEYGG